MKNRFQKAKDYTYIIVLCFFCGLPGVNAQHFVFDYTGPDTIFMDGNCIATLNWGNFTPTVVPTDPGSGQAITFFDIDDITGGFSEGDTVGPGINVMVTYLALDNQGHDSTFVFSIDFVDNTAPVFDLGTVPASASFDCLLDVPAPPAIMTIVATDNCPTPGGTSDEVTVVYNGETTPPTGCAAGVFTRSWTATDDTGNATDYVQTITINEDITPPVITGFPSDLTEVCETADYDAWLTAQRAAFTATDGGCSTLTFTDDAPAMLTSNCTAILVTFTVTDGCGLMSTTQATYTVQDITAPVITPLASNDITIQCDGIPADPTNQIITWSNNLTVTENCGTVTWSSNFAGLTGGCGGNTGTATVTYTATDACGLSDDITINFTVVDSNDPDILVGAMGTTVACDGLGNATDLTTWLNNFAGADAMDICTDDADLVRSFQNTLGATITATDIQNDINAQLATNCGASVTVRFAYTDACDNTSTTDATFAITDMTAPMWDVAPTNITINCDGTADPGMQIQAWLDNHGNGTASDDCSAVTYSFVNPGLTPGCTAFTGMATVTFTATNACGSSVSEMATVEVVDVTGAVFANVPANISIECGGMIPGDTGTVTATDACEGDLTGSIVYSQMTVASANCPEVTVVTNTWTVTDACGNVSSAMQTISIEDNTPPVLTGIPAGVTIECGDVIPGNPGTVTAMDVCTGDLTGNIIFMQGPLVAGACPNTGTITNTWSIVDACGNLMEETQVITIDDSTAPMITTAAQNETVQCDGSGNTADLAAWLAANGNAAATETCNTITWTSAQTNTTTGCAGTTATHTYEFSATDDCGNTNTTSADFIIIDTTNPSFDTPPTSVTVECETPFISYADWITAHANAVASDNCSGMALTWTENLLTDVPGCGNTSVRTVEFTVTDACGNMASATAVYTIIDTEAPGLAPTATDDSAVCGSGTEQAELNAWIDNLGGAMASDGCGGTTPLDFSYTTSDGASGNMVAFGVPVGYPTITPNDCFWSVTVVFRIEDDCNNTSTTMATFSIEDNTPPTITGIPGTLIVDCAAPPPITPMVTDNCDLLVVPVLVADTTMTNCAHDYTIIRTWTATDACGNVSTGSRTIRVQDNDAPVLVGVPMNETYDCDAPAAASPTATDNCSSPVNITFVADTIPGPCVNTYVINRTWTATDVCGNMSSETQVVTVQDNIAPTLNGVLANTAVSCDAIPDPAVVTAMDNCDANPMITFSETTTPGVCDHSYTITRTWDVVDVCGNMHAESRVITVTDGTMPSFTVPGTVTVDCENSGNLLITGSPTNLNDNCDPNPVVTFSDVISGGACPSTYTVTRTWQIADDCGNIATGMQTINVQDISNPTFDNPAANEDYTCDTDANAEVAFQAWVINRGGAVASDNCTAQGDLQWFAAVPGSYNINNVLTFPGTPVGTLDGTICPAPTGGIYRTENVDFVVYDLCGNAAVTNATFNVTDNTPPVFDYCPEDVVLTVDGGLCEASYTLPVPIISDVCGNNTSNISVMVNENIVSTNPGDEFTAVDPVILSFTGLPTAPSVGTDPVTISIDLNNVDAEQVSEYFNILGEDGSNLGITNPSGVQCGNSTTVINIPAPTFNSWTTDGVLTITLSPFLDAGQTTNFAVNDICPGGSSVDATLAYTANTPTGLVFQYSINGNPGTTVDPISSIPEVFQIGVNTVTYTATDCAGNTSNCSFTVTVGDTEAPVLTCPSDIIVALTAMDDCAAGVDVMLPLPTMATDNCGFQTTTLVQPTNPNDALLTFSLEPNYQEYIADDKTVSFPGTAANAAGTSVNLTVTINGDAEGLEEYFTIIAEDNSILGTTASGQVNVSINPQSCPQQSITTAIFSIPVALYNTWAADGTVSFTAESNMNFANPAPGGPSDGINPSCVTFPPGTVGGTPDGLSTLIMELNYNTVTPAYYVTGATTIPLTQTFPPVIAPTETFDLGTSTVFYVVSDLSGNADTCSFSVTIEDNIPPVALCQPTTIFVNPSGGTDYILDPTEIDGGSTDNCSIADMSVSPNTFTCNQAGTTVSVTLTVTDGSGNMTTCMAQVRIEIEEPMPSYSIGLCGNDTLSLFANPPAASGGVLYTYLWSGPNGFISTDENPEIPSADASNSGSYAVTVTGVTGCTGFGVVEVTINDTPDVPVLEVNSNELCTNDELILSTQTFAGNNVSYNWFIGIYPGGTFVATTSLSTFTVFSPLPAGTLTYYVIVEVDGCVSEASGFQTIEVTQAPSASVVDPVITICEGDVFTLATTEVGTGYTYQWTGPNGFTSNLQNPASVTATLADNGTYSLIISANGCPSVAATTEVIVNATPATPIISSSGVACEGEDITLFTNITDADVYTWTAPNFSTQVTTSNSLTLTNITQAEAGAWRIMVTTNGCDSEMSDPVDVFVESSINIQASNDGPTCSNDQVQLSANSIPGASYSWSGPGSFNSFSQNPLANAVAGTYSVTVTTTSGCTNTASTTVAVQAAPAITALSNDGASCVTGATDIVLVPTVFPVDDGTYQYSWIGPNGFSSVDIEPVLPNGNSIDNGSYTLIVTNSNGCSSLPVTTVVNVSDAPETPVLTAPLEICAGDLLNLTTTGYVGTTVVYNWSTPTGNIQTSTPALTLVDAGVLNSGNYSVFVTVDGCDSNLSGALTIQVNETPETPVAAGNGPVCVGSTIELQTSFIAGASYFWTGPAGFTSIVHNPVIFNATEDNTGAYTVQITMAGCSSVFSAPVNIEVNETPTPPTVQNDGPICIDAAAASLVLSVSAADAIPGATYTWYDAQTNDVVGGPTSALTVTVVDFSNYGDGIFDFYVIADLGGCPSATSIPTSVVMNTIPDNLAFAGDNIEICNETSISLNATPPTIGTGLWTQISGASVTITNPSSATSTVTGLSGGNTYEFLWTLSNGACTDYDSDAVTLIVNTTTDVAEAGLNFTICNTEEAALSATPSTGSSTGSWSQTAAQSAMGVVIVDPSDPNTSVTGLDAGETYVFTWTLSNNGCGDFATDQVLITSEQSSLIAFAGADRVLCGDGSLQLTASTPSSGQGTWTVDNPEVMIVDANDPETVVQGLETGNYVFTWTLDNGACGVTSDEVLIEFEINPILVDDQYNVSYAGSATFNVVENDQVDDFFFIEIASQPEHGTLEDLGNGQFTYRPDGTFAGTDTYTYRICSAICEDFCTEATVTLIVGNDAACIPPTIFTPNNDGVNDAFIVPCLATDRFPQNAVSMFNQWGDEVFRAAPYGNDWRGTYNGEDLPVGTYYYVINYGNGEPSVSGFLILER